MTEPALTKGSLTDLYVTLGLSDRQIADRLGLHRSTVSYARDRYHIPARDQFWQENEDRVMRKLRSLGYSVFNVHHHDATAAYTLLLNGSIKICVKGAVIRRNRVCYSLTSPSKTGQTDRKRRLINGRIRKPFEKDCHFLICTVYDSKTDTDPDYYVIPSNVIPRDAQTLSIVPGSDTNMWTYYHDRFNQIQLRLDLASIKKERR